MKKIKIEKPNYGYKISFLIILLSSLFSGCEKYLNVPLPVDRIAGDGAYVSDASTSSVLSGVFSKMYTAGLIDGGSSIGYQMAEYSDELDVYNNQSSNSTNLAIYSNLLQNKTINYWSNIYNIINTCNAAIDGISNSKTLSANKNQFLGEAYFSRAWLYFNLVNLYGDVPLALTTDYNKNNVLARAPKAQVYQQIITDLKLAQSLLPAGYQDALSLTTTVRARPDRAAATALLARIYLYTSDWVNAEKQATEVIGNADYQLIPLAQAFLAASKETIWAVAPKAPGFVNDYSVYNNGIPGTIPAGSNNSSQLITYGPTASLSKSLLNAFETNDNRKTTWLRPVTDAATNLVYYFPNKYQSGVNGTEFTVLMRLAEQYLIRAEARAMQNNTSGAQADLNMVRTRAGLPNTSAANTADLISAIAKERRVELFTETGHRFFDLKRTGTIDAVMTQAVTQKTNFGTTPIVWSSVKQILPIPTGDILIDPNLTQNPGYN